MRGIWDKTLGYFMLLRFTKQKYAKDMLDTGAIKFSTPSEWVECAKTPGGRGDIREGTLTAYPVTQKKPSLKSYKGDGDLCFVRDGSYWLVKNQRHMSLPSICFYTIFDRRENPNSSQESHISGKMFTDFTKDYGLSQREVENLPEDDRPAIVMIEKHIEFFKLLEERLSLLGISSNEILASQVNYYDMKAGCIKGYRPLMELFCKDLSYSYQNETRIVIDTKDPEILERLKEPVLIGNLDGVVKVQKWYFESGIRAIVSPNS